MRQEGEKIYRYLARRFGKKVATVVVFLGGLAYLLATCGCSAPGKLEDVGHTTASSGAAFVGGTLASGGNLAAGGVVAAAVGLTDYLVPDGEGARDETQEATFQQAREDQLEAFLDLLVQKGLVEKLTPAIREGLGAEIDERVGEIEEARAETQRSTIDQVRDLLWTLAGFGLVAFAIWFLVSWILRERAERKREERLADAVRREVRSQIPVPPDD